MKAAVFSLGLDTTAYVVFTRREPNVDFFQLHFATLKAFLVFFDVVFLDSQVAMAGAREHLRQKNGFRLIANTIEGLPHPCCHICATSFVIANSIKCSQDSP